VYQHELIEAVRALCARDEGLDAALMYGSFAKDEADEHSDVEFWLFHTRAARAALDPDAWCASVAPATAVLRNEFGAHVAVFRDLVRGEFHFATTDELPQVADWPERGAPVERMLLLDRTGRLAPLLAALPERDYPGPDARIDGDGADADADTDTTAPSTASAERASGCCEPFANWLILAHHLLARGELLRTWDALGHAVRHLTWMARLAEDSTAHWLTPSRAAESELSARSLAGLTASTAEATAPALRTALRNALAEGRRHWTTLAAVHGSEPPHALLDEIAAALD
jgi:lincosamide nucleotidyltransferase